jgi:hypothetical protein
MDVMPGLVGPAGLPARPLARPVLGDFHHTVPPLIRLTVHVPISPYANEVLEEDNLSGDL